MARESLYVMEEMLKNASTGDVLLVDYKKSRMNRRNKPLDKTMRVRVTGEAPQKKGLLTEEATVKVVKLNDDGSETNAGYIGMNALGGCEAKPDNSHFPSSKVSDVRPE